MFVYLHIFDFTCLCVYRVDPEGDVQGFLGAHRLRVSSLDEEFGQQLRASQEHPHERAGRLSELRNGADAPTTPSHTPLHLYTQSARFMIC